MHAVVGATSRHSTSRQPNTPTACGDLLFFGLLSLAGLIFFSFLFFTVSAFFICLLLLL